MRFLLTRENFENTSVLSYQCDTFVDKVSIPVHKQGSFNKFISKINKILSKLDLPKVSILSTLDTVRYRDTDGREVLSNNSGVPIYKIPCKEITIEYPIDMNPNNGWRLISVIDHDSNILKQIDKDHDVPTDLIDLEKSHCDRCNKTIRRHLTLIIFNEESNEYKRVGGSCIKFYLGPNYGLFLNALDSLNNLSNPDWYDQSMWDISGYRNSDSLTYDMRQVLRVSLNWLDKNSYVSSTSGHGTPTSWIIQNYFDSQMNPYSRKDGSEYISQNMCDIFFSENDRPHKYENEISVFVYNLNREKSSYNFNLQNIFNNQYITRGQFGLLISVIPFFKKSTDRLEKKKEFNNEYVGTVGDKYSFQNITVIKMYDKEGDFGSYTQYIMEDTLNHRLIKNGTINKRYSTDKDDVKEGSVLIFDGEIRDHREYNGLKSTVIGRISKYTKNTGT